MFAIFKTGGKQYKVHAGDIVKIEKLDVKENEIVEFQEILMLDDGKESKVGTPTLAKAVIKASIVSQTRDQKIIVFKKKRRQGYDRKHGHRQHLSVVHIDEIVDDGRSLAKASYKKPKTVDTKPAKKTKLTNSTASKTAKENNMKAADTPRKSKTESSTKTAATSTASKTKKESSVKTTKQSASSSKTTQVNKKESDKTKIKTATKKITKKAVTN